MDDIKTILENLYWDELKKEGITKDDVELVDLDIAFSPVTPFINGSPEEVIKLNGGKYRIPNCLELGLNISADVIRVMRFRYLQFDPERVRQRNAINNMFKT